MSVLKPVLFCRLNLLKVKILLVKARQPAVRHLTALAVVVQLPRRHREHHPHQGPVCLEVVAAVGPAKKMTVMMMFQVWQGPRQQKQHWSIIMRMNCRYVELIFVWIATVDLNHDLE